MWWSLHVGGALLSKPCPQHQPPLALVSPFPSPALPSPTHVQDYLVKAQLLTLLRTLSHPSPLDTLVQSGGKWNVCPARMCHEEQSPQSRQKLWIPSGSVTRFCQISREKSGGLDLQGQK